MNTATFKRKIFYMLAMVALLIPLFLLGQPPSGPRGQGGTLAKLRERFDIGQSSLGQLDPASETMRLASLGLRGVAATILWQYADRFKEEKYWDLLSATLNQLSLLQPHFVSVWESQAHNLAYNVSSEFDDYRERYVWVKKGIDFLVRGTQFNRRQPLLQYHLGKYTTLKLGRSDEKRQFRELFRNDNTYHKTLMDYGLDLEQPEATGSDRKPDNWLVGRLWFIKSYDLVHAGYYCKKSPIIYFGEAPWALFYYGEAIEDEGVLDDKAMFAWSRAAKAWSEYGNLDLMTTWGHTIQLRGLDSANEATLKAVELFREQTKELLPELIEQGKDRFTTDEYALLQKPEADRTPQEQQMVDMAMQKVMLAPHVLAQRMPREKRAESIQLANELSEKSDFAFRVDRSREMVNYQYWETRGELEQTPTAVAARRHVYEAEKYLIEADLNKAIQSYELAWKNWDRVLRRYPMMLHEESSDALLKSIERYATSTDSTLGDDFPLNWFYRYRAIRDKNKAGDETIRLYDEFVREAENQPGNLDTPIEQ
ncbi:MAG: IRE (iron responsive element) [Pirellulaceae bacterium]|nr:IRE (iron responsive element) [Pirellulaceae bacterium]